MALDDAERQMYSDVVQVTNRSDKPVEFQYDSRIYKFKPLETKHLPRFVAVHGISKLPIEVDPFSSLTLSSFLHIEGDDTMPEDPVDFSPADIRDKPKYDLGVMMIGGKASKMQELTMSKPSRENYAQNNNPE